MPHSNVEQYILELINRARLDPITESERLGVPLNQGLAPDEPRITGDPLQPLAADSALASAADSHSDWMLANDTFSHTGVNGTRAGDRIEAAGYEFGDGWHWAENLGIVRSSSSIAPGVAARSIYDGLFESADHRPATLGEDFREIGLGMNPGQYGGLDTWVLTENFALAGTAADVFLTGVAYRDGDGNDFYSIGEGIGGIVVSVADEGSATTSGAGGYEVALPPTAVASATVTRNGNLLARLEVDLAEGNGKLDMVQDSGGEWSLALSASASLLSGISTARLLGAAAIDLEGHGGANHLTGNRAANTIAGMDGDDVLLGLAGADRLEDGAGADRMTGGSGGDLFVLAGDGATDRITDFDPAQDRLDLSGWSGLADMSGLSISTLSDGAQLSWGDETLVLTRAGGGSLGRADLGGRIAFGDPLPDAPATAVPTSLEPDPLLAARTPVAGDIVGTPEGDVLRGTPGADALIGQAGGDWLEGGPGADSHYGGLGNDRYILEDPDDRIGDEPAYSQGGGIDTVEAWHDFALPSGVEILRLQGEADLQGWGSGGPDALVGNSGSNLLGGGYGDDTITAKAGNDTLFGGPGADQLVADEGADVFLFAAVSDSRAGPENRDFINGFVHGLDLIDLSPIDARPDAPGNQAFEFLGTEAFSGTGGELRWFTFGGMNVTIVEADVDGDRSADMQIFVNLTDWMTGSDFLL